MIKERLPKGNTLTAMGDLNTKEDCDSTFLGNIMEKHSFKAVKTKVGGLRCTEASTGSSLGAYYSSKE